METLPILFEQFQDYKHVIEGNTPRTIKWYKEVFKLFLKHSKAEHPKELTRLTFEKWLHNGRKEFEWSNRTIRSRIQVFRLFLDWSVERGFHRHNFARDMKLPRIQHRNRTKLSRDKAVSLLDWTLRCPFNTRFERYRALAIIGTFLYTGVRKSELLNLNVTDIKFDESMVAVRSGKGDADRLLPLHPKLGTLLHKYLEERTQLEYRSPKLIVSSQNDQVLSERQFRRLMIKIRDFSGIQFSAHVLRHTFATLMIEGGANIYALSKMLGHTSITTTTIYLEATTVMLQNDMEKLPL